MPPGDQMLFRHLDFFSPELCKPLQLISPGFRGHRLVRPVPVHKVVDLQAVRVLGVGASRRRHRLVREAELCEAGRVEPEVVAVPRLQDHGPVGPARVEHVLRGQRDRILPPALPPAVADHELVARACIGHGSQRIGALLGRVALAEHREPRAPDGRAREVEVRVVEAGTYEGVAQIEHARSRPGERADILGASDRGDPVARDGDGAGCAGISDGGEEAVRPDDEVDGHVGLQSAGPAGLCDNSGTAGSAS